MKIACGIDSIQISRIREILETHGEMFLARVYTPTEQALCEAKGKHSAESYAARYAAKEAVSKALGTGIGRDGVRFVDIEILCDDRGKPILQLHGKTHLLFSAHFGQSSDISLTHEADLASAVCVMLFSENDKEGIRT